MTGPAPLAAAVAAARRGDQDGFARAVKDAVAAAENPTMGWRGAAIRLTGAGLHRHAAACQRRAVALSDAAGTTRPDDATFLGDLLLRAEQLRPAIDTLEDVRRRWPGFTPAILLLAACWSAAARFATAVPLYRDVLARSPDNLIALDGLARAAGWLGERDAALAAGRRSLELKDRAVTTGRPAWTLSRDPAPPFDPARPERNVIAYGLWGSAPRYVETALRNAETARDIYPAWRCRFYCDETVPKAARDGLAGFGATVVMKPVPQVRAASLFWRFLVADDPSVDRFLARDADSLLTVRERVAVDDWLASDLPFHAMRDWWSHTELMLAGMWGGTGQLLTGIEASMAQFLAGPEIPHRALDQRFLAQVVWPAIRGRCLIHDDLYGSLGARPWPPLGRLPPGEHVGMNAVGYAEARERA